MDALSAGLLDLRLPGPSAEAASVFAPSVTTVDIGPGAELTATNANMVESLLWPLATPAKQAAKIDLWRPLLDAVSFFDHARLHIVSGEHPSDDMWRYEATGAFEALARMKSGEWRSLHATMRLSWARTKTNDGKAGEWQITGWKTEEMHWNASARRLFVEALDTALRAPQDPQALRRSQHYEATLKYYREGMKKLPHPYFAPISVNQKEGIAVADVNGDGFDDIYIMVRLGTNMLLINHGDGTFTEEAAKYHLDLPGHTTCAIFADFDNDGDLDVILGRSLLRSTYLENRNGVFYQPPIPKFMPMAVISMSAADYNADGLLDVYLCTYRPAPPAGSGTGGGYASSAKEGDFDWLIGQRRGGAAGTRAPRREAGYRRWLYRTSSQTALGIRGDEGCRARHKGHGIAGRDRRNILSANRPIRRSRGKIKDRYLPLEGSIRLRIGRITIGFVFNLYSLLIEQRFVEIRPR
jgi:hypothetical protein